MKKYFLTSVLIFCSFWSLCFAADLTQYQNVQFIQELDTKQPKIVEIVGLKQSGDYVVTNDTNEIIPQQMEVRRKSRIIPPQIVEGCTPTCKDASTLVDGRVDTTFDFPLASNGVQRGRIHIVYTKPLETDSITFQVTGDSYMPTMFTLTIDGKRILNTMQGGNARFPKMIAQDIDIQFEYLQPIRFTEVGVGLNVEEEVSSVVRFVYQPNTKYMMYTDSPTGRESLPTPPINLFSKEKEAEITLLETHKNPLFKERDTDGDGVIDGVDNCVRQSNPDQKDGNRNGIGDMCDDYDYDGVMTAVDNCPEISNPDQMDTDKDGMGDACDKEESRVTEKYAWMPWVVFVGVFLAIVGMGYEVVRMKKKKDETGV